MKYAPANENGEKPYVVRLWNFGNESTRIVFGQDASEARRIALGGRAPTYAYVLHCRRATPDDLVLHQATMEET